jgi:hypothetical protein
VTEASREDGARAADALALRIDEPGFTGNSRLAAVIHASHVLRAVQLWRHVLSDADHDYVMILLAVMAISSERLLRTEMPPDLRKIDAPIDASRLAKVNLLSIAHATGINRETVRRKVGELVEQEFLVRLPDRTIRYRDGLLMEDRILDILRRHIGGVATTSNRLLALKVLVPENSRGALQHTQ